MMATQSTFETTGLEKLIDGLVPAGDVVDAYISSIEMDSRKVKSGSLFVGLNGSNTSGRNFVKDAIAKGATAIVLENDTYKFYLNNKIPVYELPEIRLALGQIVARFYDNPSEKIKLTGVTGTNGKTSVVYFLSQAINHLTNKPVGTIGTLGYGTAKSIRPADNTTPDVITLNALLDDFHHQGIEQVVMEVSSHGLDQGRVNNIDFDTVVFTNLSQDHLDYHHDMKAYGNTKRELFFLPSVKNAVINIGDSLGAQIAADISDKINLIRFKLTDAESDFNSQEAELGAVITNRDINSMSMNIYSVWGNGPLTVNLVGDYNAGNILACLGVLCSMNISFADAVEALSKVKTVPGRLELFNSPTSPKIFVDYSHTPDALEKAIQTLRNIGCSRLVCIFGCGGDRDREKRQYMGKIAEQHCDAIILTNDNPRNEPAENIISDIQSGMKGGVLCEIDLDRAHAIQTAIDTYGPDDFILVAGKGHETYQEINGMKIPFSDRQLVVNLLERSS